MAVLTGCAATRIQKKESFLSSLYRRIHYKAEGDYRIVDMFYATARNVKVGGDGKLSFDRNVADNMTFGTFSAKIDPGLSIGKMIPSMLKSKGLINLDGEHVSNMAAFEEDLKAAVDSSPHKSLLILVFGFKDNFEITAIKSAYFSYLLDVNTPILMFDWPGDQKVRIRGYLRAARLADKSGEQLGKLIVGIVREVKPEHIWIIGSSLGCEVICEAFNYMYQHSDFADKEREIDEVILAAPDVRKESFKEHFKDKVTALSKKLTVYVSSNDRALLMSEIISGGDRLGRVEKPALRKHEQLDETKDILYLKSLEPDLFEVVDVTPINTASYGHGYYLEAPEFYDDVYLRIFDQPSYANRRLYLLKYNDDLDYWVLRSD
ncbi:MAG: alpha/beta hydrolase [Candidatus Omnitrophota bacterium]